MINTENLVEEIKRLDDLSNYIKQEYHFTSKQLEILYSHNDVTEAIAEEKTILKAKFKLLEKLMQF